MKKTKKKRFSYFSFFVFIACIILVFNINSLNINIFTVSFGSLKLEKVISENYKSKIEYLNNSNVYVIDEGFLKIDDGYLEYLDSKFNPLWKKEVSGVNIEVASKYGINIIYDKELGNIYSFNLDGSINAKLLGLGSIKTIKIKDSSKLIVYLESEQKIIILDTKLKKIDEVLVNDILDFDVSNDKDILAITYLNIDKDDFFSIIQIYNLNGKMLKLINFDNEIVLGIKVIDDKIYVVSTSWVRKYDVDNNIVYEYKFDKNISKFKFDKNANLVIYLVSDNLEDFKKNAIILLDNNGKKVFEKDIDDDIEKIEYNFKKIVYLSAKKMYIIDEKGETLGIRSFSENILDFRLYDINKFGIFFSDKFEYYLLK